MGAALVAAQLAVAANEVNANIAQNGDEYPSLQRSPRTPPSSISGTEQPSPPIDAESILLAYSAERGKFETDDPIPAFVPFFPERPQIPFHTSWFKTSP